MQHCHKRGGVGYTSSWKYKVQIYRSFLITFYRVFCFAMSLTSWNFYSEQLAIFKWFIVLHTLRIIQALSAPGCSIISFQHPQYSMILILGLVVLASGLDDHSASPGGSVFGMLHWQHATYVRVASFSYIYSLQDTSGDLENKIATGPWMIINDTQS